MSWPRTISARPRPGKSSAWGSVPCAETASFPPLENTKASADVRVLRGTTPVLASLGRMQIDSKGKRLVRRMQCAGLVAALLGGWACSGGGEEAKVSDGQGNGIGNGSGGLDGGTGSTGGLLPGGLGGEGSQGNGLPEVCDGKDTNGDGIIDNVDKDGDGICDCLLLATLGAPGEWGDGDVFDDWLDSRSDNGAAHLGDQEITSELLAGFQVVVIQDLRGRTYSDAEVEALNAWIAGGGGLMTLIGYGDSSERTNVNALLEPTGLSYGSQGILAKNGDVTRPVNTWFEHATSNGVMSIGVDNGYPVLGAGTVVAEEDGHVVARALTVEDGRVFVWGDEWITYNSEWEGEAAENYQVERFWLNVIKWLTPANTCQVPIPTTVR